MKNPFTKKLSLPVLVSVILTLLPLLTTSLLTAWAIGHEALLRSWPFNYWILITAILMVTSALALSPPTFLALVYGYFLGWVAFPLLVGLNFGAIGLVYGLARLLDPNAVRVYLMGVYPKAKLLVERFDEDGFRLIFFAKISPVLPFAVTNLFFALAGGRLKQVLIAGTLGMIPRTILAIWAGREARDISYLLSHPNEGLGTKIVLITLIIASTIGIGYFFKDKSMKKD